MQLNTRGAPQQIMLARYYEAGVGRFLSADPASNSYSLPDPQSWNRYAYASNNPLRYWDADGRESSDPVAEAIREAAIEAGARSAAKYVLLQVTAQHVELPGLDALFMANTAADAFDGLATKATAHTLQTLIYNGVSEFNKDAEAAAPPIDEICRLLDKNNPEAKKLLKAFLKDFHKTIVELQKQGAPGKPSSSNDNGTTGSEVAEYTCSVAIGGQTVKTQIGGVDQSDVLTGK